MSIRKRDKKIEYNEPSYNYVDSIVDSFRMTKERRWDNSEWPGWLGYAWQKDSYEDGCVFISNDNMGRASSSDKNTDSLVLRTKNGLQPIEWGDHIVLDDCFELSIYSHSTFLTECCTTGE